MRRLMLGGGRVTAASGGGGNGGIEAQFPNATNTGHTNAPGFTSLSPGGAVTSGNTYNFLDFADGLTLNNIDNVTFNGCRFQSNSNEFANIRLISCDAITFNYCSIVPLVSLHATPTHPGTWPSAGAGEDVHGQDGGGFEPYMIPWDDAYQYGIRMESGCTNIIISHCDLWGWGNSIDLVGADDVLIEHTWIHDAGSGDNGTIPDAFHHDGPGYLDGGGPPSGITVNHCTIASLGNTNAIAYQAATSPYVNMIVNDCYLTGFGVCVDMCHNVSGNTGLEFTNNVIGTDIRWFFSMLRESFAAQFGAAGNVWSGNRFHVLPGTSRQPGSSPAWTAADDGKFIHPDGSLQTTDFE